jgi:hypothetical protein
MKVFFFFLQKIKGKGGSHLPRSAEALKGESREEEGHGIDKNGLTLAGIRFSPSLEEAWRPLLKERSECSRR